MTQRLLFFPLSSAEYFALRAALEVRSIDSELGKREKNKALALIEKLDGAWDVKGREGRGLDTRLPKRKP